MPNKEYDKLTEKLLDLLEDAPQNPYISKNWEMRDGIYQQYSAFRDSAPCESGTINSLTSK